MASTTRTLSIHKTPEAAARSLDFDAPAGATVEQGVQGTTEERPWAVVAPKKTT
jgi:hypothetical protein